MSAQPSGSADPSLAIYTQGLSRQFGAAGAVHNLNLAIEKAHIFGF